MEFNGQWYVFYHRSTHNSQMMRKACMEPIFFNEDGSIDEVEMTSQGAGPPLQATSLIPAERACLLHGNLRIRSCAESNEELTGICRDDRAAYKYVDFGTGVDTIVVRVKPGAFSGGINFMADMPWGPNLGYVEVPQGVDKEAWITVSAPVKGGDVEGVRALWLVFHTAGDEAFSVDWLMFK